MPAANRPNVLLIMTDQQRGDCLGCDGHPVIETPVLDSLAEQGTRFKHAYSAVPACVPARAALISGMDQWHTGLLSMGPTGKIPSNFKHTLPGEFASAGYHTQGIGKMNFHPQRTLNGFHDTQIDEGARAEDDGFVSDYRAWLLSQPDSRRHLIDPVDVWQSNSWVARPGQTPTHLHQTHWTAQSAMDWVDRRDPGKPFMLKVSFTRPHTPYDPPQEYFDLYKDREIPAPHLGEWSEVNDKLIANTNAWRSHRPDHEIQRARAAYYASITFIDDQIGRMLGHLRKRHSQAWRNTLVIFCSDHGDMLGDHHLWRKTYGYEGSTRVPMIVRPPDSSVDAVRGQVRDEVVELRDVMPTLLDGAGLQVPDTCQGQSMMPLAKGQSIDWRPWLMGEFVRAIDASESSHFLTDGKTKYIWFHVTGRELLFDLSQDPGETQNLADDPASLQRLNTWRGRLIDELSARQKEAPQYPLVKDGKLATVGAGHVLESPHWDSFGRIAQ